MITKTMFREKAGWVANGLFIGEGSLCLLILAYCLYYYSWTHERTFSSPVGPILYYGLPAIMASLLFAALRLRLAQKVSLVLLLVSIDVSIVAAELLCLFSNDILMSAAIKERVNAAKAAGVTFDTRSKLEVVTALQTQGLSAAPAMAPGSFLKPQLNGTLQSDITTHGTQVLPLAGIANTVTIFCNESGAYVMYRSDEYGFHNPPGLWKGASIALAAVGDSFTIGACVPSDKNFVALLRSYWPATLNLGSIGIGPLIELAILKEYGHYLQPQVVLWCYFEGNDLRNLRREKDSPLLMRYLQSDFTQGLLTSQTEIDQALTAYLDRLKHARRPLSNSGLASSIATVLKFSGLRQRLGLTYGDLLEDQRRASEAELELFRAVLSEAQASVSRWQGRLYFSYLPDWPRYAGQGRINDERERVLTIVTSLGLPVIDVHPAFQAQPDPLAAFPFRLHNHYNEKGHQLMAEEIRQELVRRDEMDRSRAPSITRQGGIAEPLAGKAIGDSIAAPTALY